MNINATAANKIAWVMNNNQAEQFSGDESEALRSIIDSIMEKISKTAFEGKQELEFFWADSTSSMRQEVRDYLTCKMGYTVVEYFYGYEDDSFVIKW